MKKEHLIDAIACRTNDNVLEVSRILRDTQRRHIIVLDDKDAPVGIISTIDINNRVVSEEKNPKEIKATDIMTKNPQSVELEDTYENAFQKMAKLGTNSIPVTSDGKLIGMLEFMTAFGLRRDSK